MRIRSARSTAVWLCLSALMLALPAVAGATPSTHVGAGSRAPSARSARASGEAPVNPAWIHYQQNLAAGTLPRSYGSNALGYSPGPISFSYLRGDQLKGAARFYPAQYDLRSLNRVSPVVDQNPYGTCWTFATCASLESCLLPGQSLDFSEDNIALTNGFDKHPVGYGQDYYYDQGGWSVESAAYLVRWSGPVYESDDAYGDWTTPPNLAVRKHVQEVLFLPLRSGPLDNDNIKLALTTHGGIWTSIYADDGMASSSDSSYWDQSNSSYYYNGSNYTDHAVTIVGWDDTYSRYNFSTTPPGNGAFIVKNSWGKGWGDNGYFYVSYYDSWIGSSENAVYDNAEPTNNYSHIYQWDPLGLCTWAWYFASGTTGWFANVFTAQSNDALAAVSFYSATPNSTYDVYTGNSVGGSKTLRTSGTLAVPGYHTVSLPSSVALSNGQSFVVFVRLTTPGWNWPVPLETPVNKGGASYSGSASASPGQSYVSASGSSWTDVTTFDGDSETNVCLKAFTSAAASPTPPTVTSPNGGGSWQVGDSQNITWTAGTGTGAAIAISRDGGSSWDDVATGLSNSGTYSWTVSGPATTQAKIRVTTSAGADASNAVFTITQASDGTPPTTTASGYDSAWHNTQVVVHLSAVDNGGSGVASTWYKVDSGSWTQGTLVTISAPAGGGNDGMHTVYFYSVDNATNTEAQKSCQVSIDTVGPICKAKNVTAKKGKLCKLHFYVGDAHSSQVTTVIRVKTLAGATKKTFSWGYDTANKWWITTSYICTLKKGTYRYYVYGKDLAGNAQSVVGSAKLKVK